MPFLDSFSRNSSSGGVGGALTRAILRFLQFVMAITVAGLYGIDLSHNAVKDGRWVFAEVVAGLSAISVIFYGAPFLKSYWFFAWDIVLFIMWTALFGIFGRIYIGFIPSDKDVNYSAEVRMKNAVWIDLVNMILWLITAGYSTVMWLRSRGSDRTLHTGRAKV